MSKRVERPHSRGLEKKGLHPRNRHRKGYDFTALMDSDHELVSHVKVNEHGIETIDFADPVAVKILNRALLRQYYRIDDWDIPAGFLCPPIPGRVDYIHYVADLLGVNAPIADVDNAEPIRMLEFELYLHILLFKIF